MSLQSVGQTREGFVGVPLRCNASDDFDNIAVTIESVLETVAPIDRVRVAQITDKDGRLVTPASLTRDADELRYRVLHQLAVVRYHGDRVSIVRRGRAVEVDDWHARRIRRTNRGNHSLVISVHHDDAIHGTLDHRL